jgi:hypothetical protein
MDQRVLQKVCLLLGFYAIGCSPRPQEPMVDEPLDGDISDVVSHQDTIRHDPIGTWVLTGFHDSIAVHRRIGRYRRPAAVWTSLLLRVDSAVVRSNGILLPRTERYARWGRDTLLVLEPYGEQTFVYDARQDRIRVFFRDDAGPKERSMEYRRLRLEEHHLLTGIDSQHRDSAFVFEENYHTHLTGLLFAGRFEPLDRGQHAFSIDERGRITGHPIWDQFWFHDYFGTLHPFSGDMDGLVFTDTTKQWPHSTFPFNWRFAGDTLILRPLKGDEYYHLSEGEFRFMKHH